MNINESNIKLSKEERMLLSKFFNENMEFISSNNFYEYENIKLFGNLYEEFIDKNNLRENDIMMLFLAEIRYDELAYKITKDTNKMKVVKMSIPKNRLNDTISKWYRESRVVEYVNLNTSADLRKKLEQNFNERLLSEEEASKIRVR